MDAVGTEANPGYVKASRCFFPKETLCISCSVEVIFGCLREVVIDLYASVRLPSAGFGQQASLESRQKASFALIPGPFAALQTGTVAFLKSHMF